jgi:enoyl-CoA hydratase/carnithine racemase
MVGSDVLSYDVRDRKAFVTITRPEAMNALSRQVFRLLGEAARDAQNDDERR